MPDEADVDEPEWVRPSVVHGSAAEVPGEEIVSAAIDLPWDDYLGRGARDRIIDGSLGLIRHAHPPTAARDLREAATEAGMLGGDAAVRERLSAIGLAVAALHGRPARMPHSPGDEPTAWWLGEERRLIWMPIQSGQPPYGLELVNRGDADSVTVVAPDACWTVFVTGIPADGASGRWDDLPARCRRALERRIPGIARPSVRWHRRSDAVHVRWRSDRGQERLRIAVNRTPEGLNDWR